MEPNQNNNTPQNGPARSKRPPRGNRQNGNGKNGGRKNGQNNAKQQQPALNVPGATVSRGAAVRAQKRTQADAQKIANQYAAAPVVAERRANFIDDSPRLKLIGLGGMNGGGSKNMLLVEYLNDAVVLDCGNDLGVDLPGINYGIADTAYLETIKHKLRAYIITHGHLDHIGGLPHIVPKFPAPVYGSRFTVGMIEKIFENFGVPMPEGFALQTIVMNEETHERLKVGPFFVELVRVTHSIPGSTVVVLDTPAGRLVNTGDFRLDPNPLDHERTDTERLKQLGDEGVLALLSESTTADRPGRTPSESTIEPTFVELFANAPGRVFVALFSSNINRVQMLVNAATQHGRKIAMDGRSMMSTLEVAVKLGMIRIPKGTFVPIANVPNMREDEIVVISTGAQGEPSSALQRMATGDHKHVKLKAQDTVILSATPIPESGNDKHISAMVDNLMRAGVHVFRHDHREVDGCGPLHVSGHASQEEYGEMIDMTRPRFFVPIYGSYTGKQYHIELAVSHGVPRKNTINIDNGQVLAFTPDKMEIIGQVPHGTILVDQTGQVVNSVVVKDRVLMAEEGIVAVVLTVDKKSGNLLTSPDIISRGFIYMRDNEDLMNGLRAELRRAVGQRFKRVDLDRFKIELKDHITHYLFEQTGRSPIVIPVVNVIGGKGEAKNGHGNGNGNASANSNGNGANGQPQPEKTPEEIAAEQQQRFQRMRERLLGQDARVD
ncbi:MAG TPA: ribonuclease J [Candidatus Saccharimonadales bacterium]|nr:ribonuclease J [Candidatus Saccharimonadales bacterium]